MRTQTHKTMPEDKQDELMSKLAEWRGVAESGCKQSLDDMQKNEDFANGDQWDTAVKADMEDQGKYVATIPLIRPQINQMVGNVVSNPKDITVVNTHGGMQAIAAVNTALLKHAMEENDGVNLSAQWFQRGVTTNRGFLAWFLDHGRDPIQGDLKIRLLPEMDCLWDPTCKSYDFNGTCGGGDAAKFFFWDEWVDQDWAEAQWPEVSNNFTAVGSSLFNRAYHSVTCALYGLVGKGSNSRDRLSSRSTQRIPDYAATRYRLQHCWWMEYRECWYWYAADRPTTEPMILIDRKDISEAKRATEEYPDQFRMVKNLARILHHTLSIGSQFIEDRIDEFGLASAGLTAFPIVPYYPSHSWGRATGIVTDMIGPQESLNWLRTYVINHLKLLPNSGWVIEKDIDNYSQVLREQSGQAAQVIERARAGGHIEKIQPTPFPGGIDAISDKAKLELREVSNIRTEAPEQDTAELSGRAILAKQANSQTGVAPALANFDWSVKIFGKIGVDIIRCSGVYSDDEIKAIIEQGRLVDDNLLHETRMLVCGAIGIEFPQEPAMPNPEMFASASIQVKQSMQQMYVQERQIYESLLAQIDAQALPMAIQALIDASRNAQAGRYHTTVALSPYSISARMSQLANIIDTNKLLVESGYPPLPERDILEASELPHKERLLKERGYAA